MATVFDEFFFLITYNNSLVYFFSHSIILDFLGLICLCAFCVCVKINVCTFIEVFHSPYTKALAMK